jgi:hypothetical protein
MNTAKSRRFAQYLKTGMVQKRIKNIAELWRQRPQEFEITYEHLRRAIRGESLPSLEKVKVLCDVLDLDFAKAKQLRELDQLSADYTPEALQSLLGAQSGDHLLDAVSRSWTRLTTELRRGVHVLVESWANANE